MVPGARLRATTDDLEARREELHDAVPVIGARLRDETWLAGPPQHVAVVDGDPLDDRDLDRPFDLADEPPLRLVRSADGLRLGVIGHHAAFDGLALVAVLRALTAGDRPQPVTSPPPGTPGYKLPLLERLARPADPVAATPGVWPGDAYASTVVDLQGKGITGRIAAACVGAVATHNARHDRRLRKVGLTIAVGGPAGVGNVASYRRIDV